VWVIRRRSKLKPIETFCFSLGVASIGMFAYLGEKVPWLLVHQVYPFVPLAGAQLARTFSPKGRRWSQALAGIGIVATAWSMLASSFVYPTLTTSDPHGELIVFVQTTPEANAVAKRGVELARRERLAPPETTGGQPPRPIAAVSGEASWPLSWQWTDLGVIWALPSGGQRPLLVVCDPSDEERARAELGEGYVMRRIPLRAWWVEEYRGLTPGRVLKWFVTRQAWSPIGATEVTVFEDKSQ
jgi:predicted membrane-bound mannosyltransferase